VLLVIFALCSDVFDWFFFLLLQVFCVHKLVGGLFFGGFVFCLGCGFGFVWLLL
jgi:hypothetical protein